MSKTVLIGSVEAYSGKSGIILGIAPQLQARGLTLAYGKPLGARDTEYLPDQPEADLKFISQALGLNAEHQGLPLVYLDQKSIQGRLLSSDTTDYTHSLQAWRQQIQGDLVLLEGSGTLWEGNLFGLSTIQLAEVLDAPIVLVSRYHSALVVDALLQVKQVLGDRLLGVIINDIPPSQLEDIGQLIRPFLEDHGISVLGLMPSSKWLRSVSVRELARELKASVLCRPDRLDLRVESLTIGAMNVNSALEYFRRGENKAVVTGGDRTDLQLAALETSTSCLILTGHMSPEPWIISRAEDLEVPILSVNLDTLSTVEIVDQAFGRIRLQEQFKVDCIQAMMTEYFDFDRFLQAIGIDH